MQQENNSSQTQSAQDPRPFTPPNCDTSRLPYMPVEVGPLFKSPLWHLSSGDEFKATFKLMGESWSQVPAASLPQDDRILASLVGVSLAKWKRLKTMALSEWTLCSDGRFYHRLISEKALTAWIARLEADLRSARGNAKQGKRHRPHAQIERELEEAEACLARLPITASSEHRDLTGDPAGDERGDPHHSSQETKVEGEVETNTPPSAAPPSCLGVGATNADAEHWTRRLQALWQGSEEYLSSDRRDEVWIRGIQWFESQGFDFERHVLPGCRAAFRALQRRKHRDAEWDPLRVLHHQLVIREVCVARDRTAPSREDLNKLMEQMRAYSLQGA